jgi:glycerol uptake facilitator protein
MATKKAKKAPAKAAAAKPKTTKPVDKKVEKVIVEEVVVSEKVKAASGEKGAFCGFFAKKYDENENILTIFKSPKIYGALLGEIIGSLIVTFLLVTLGLYQPLYIMFGIMAVTIAVYAFSGAHINPLVTVGMMATRRVSPIRGILYIVAQIFGAWLGLLIAIAFNKAGGEMYTLPVLEALPEDGGMFWATTLLEFFGATIIAFFFARAWAYRKNVFTFGAVVGGGVALALLFAIVVSSNFLGTQNGFVLNPAVAIMYQMLPTAGDGFWALIGDIAIALVTYAAFPMIGGVVGFYLSDLAAKLTGKDLGGCGCVEEDCCCK